MLSWEPSRVPFREVTSVLAVADQRRRLARRPSHADKQRAWRRALLGEESRAVLRPGLTEAEIQAAADRLLSLAA
jgi:hypothetical protein